MLERGAKRLTILAWEEAVQGGQRVLPGAQAVLIAPQNKVKLPGYRYAIPLSGNQ